ncbi:hypothetical protein QBC40DRAFT_185790 [Triangularia verruculosa]|uniref:Uncharacterized protein n=1 Tax=Triangularia verruculosa TaxID=2587418 RepID=A0AAN7ANM3_9PEZI|nr:hypothetical protein QBC40DRAFT_185790 [Triangularia verruculosa]
MPRSNPPFRSKARPHQNLLYLFAVSLIFCILFCSFIYVVLIQGKVETPGPVFWNAVTTNYVVSVLSQFSAILTAATIKSVLGVLRTAFVHGETGMRFGGWVGLGGSEYLSVLQVAWAEGWLGEFWCDLRLSLPLLSLLFGSIVKFQADFTYHFRPSAETQQMDIYAGLIPPDLRVLNHVSAADIAMFHLTWASSLQTNSMFARDFYLDGCDPVKSCRAVIMPGGLTTARQAEVALNESVYFEDYFDHMDTIRVENATAFVLKYQTPPELEQEKEGQGVVFDVLDSQECVYSEVENNRLQVCVRQVGASILAGWSACPKDLLDLSLCQANASSWRQLPFISATLMSLYTVPTKTSYSLDSQSIVDLVPLLPFPMPASLSAKNYLTILSRILIPPSVSNTTKPASADDEANIRGLVYSITWMHRTFLKSFPSDRTSATGHLHNLLAIPLQFAITATTFANYSAAEKGLQKMFTLPESMRTRATGGWSSSKLMILPWAGWLFIGADVAVHATIAGAIIWVLVVRQGGVLPDEGAIKELGDVTEASRLFVVVGDDRKTGRWRWVSKLFKGTAKKAEASASEERQDAERITLSYFAFASTGASRGDGTSEVSAFILARRYRGARVFG